MYPKGTSTKSPTSPSKDPQRQELGVKQLILNDLDGGRGSGLPPKRRTRFTCTNSTSPKELSSEVFKVHSKSRKSHSSTSKSTSTKSVSTSSPTCPSPSPCTNANNANIHPQNPQPQNQLPLAKPLRSSTSVATTMVSDLSLKHCRRTFSAEDLPRPVVSTPTSPNYPLTNLSPVHEQESFVSTSTEDEYMNGRSDQYQSDKSEKVSNIGEEIGEVEMEKCFTEEEDSFYTVSENDLNHDEKDSDDYEDTETDEDLKDLMHLQDDEDLYFQSFQSFENFQHSNVTPTPLEENIELNNSIEQERKELLKRKVISNLAFELVRRQNFKISSMEEDLQKKKEEVAARLILHNLLLNSWRIKNGELSCVSSENAQLHKTIDNLCLQLRVVRHLQTTEKEKSAMRNREFDTLCNELTAIKTENRQIRIELEKVALERNSLHSTVETLTKDHDKVSSKYQSLKDRKDYLIKSSEINLKQAEQFQRENQQLQKEVGEVRDQLKLLTKQSSHWQEKARSLESECWKLKFRLDEKDSKVQALLEEKSIVEKEKEILKLSKRKTEDKLNSTIENLDQSIQEKNSLENQLKEWETQLDSLDNQIGTLNISISCLNKENVKLRQTLYDYSLKNVRKRRVWGKALYFIFNPFEIFRTLYFGVPNCHPLIPRGGNNEKIGIIGIKIRT